MERKTCELEGYLLDAAVAKALGLRHALARTLPDTPGPYRCTLLGTCERFEPSALWADGGPIIEREGIELWKWKGSDGTYWCAHVGGRRVGESRESIGETPLVAAMRAFAFSRHGDTVDL